MHIKPPFRIMLLLCGMALQPVAGAAESPQDDWEALLAELEAFEAVAEWGYGEPVEPEGGTAAAPACLFSAAVAAGLGHSDNFLKRPVAVGSDFWRFAGDANLIWFLPSATLTGAVWYDRTGYADDLEVSSETLFMVQGTGRLERTAWGAGLEAQLVYSDQIYDASLTTLGAPAGARIRQVLPEATLYWDWLAGRTSQVRAEATVARAEFNEPEEDYWQAGTGTQLQRGWRSGVNNTTRLEWYYQWYDTKPARVSVTFAKTAPPRVVEVRGLRLENRIDWSPPAWPWASLQLTAGAAWEQDRYGDYNSLRRAWAGIGPRAAFSWGHIRLTGRWLENRYTDRRVSLRDPHPLLQTHRHLRAEVLCKLPDNLVLKLQAQWGRLASRLATESYSERRAEAALEWRY